MYVNNSMGRKDSSLPRLIIMFIQKALHYKQFKVSAFLDSNRKKIQVTSSAFKSKNGF